MSFAFLFSPMHVTWPAHRIVLHFITLRKVAYKLWSSLSKHADTLSYDSHVVIVIVIIVINSTKDWRLWTMHILRRCITT
jgi:hypothetical protein